MNPPETIPGSSRHAGPHLGLVAIVFAALKFASLIPVSAFGFAVGIKPPYFPGPAAPANDIVAYFDTHRLPVLICAFFQFGATVPLGIFTATIVSRLQFLGAKAAGVHIALFGGLAVAFDSAASAFVLWAMAQIMITQDASLVRALYYLQSAFGSTGYAVPMGLLLAGISIPAGPMKLLPKWVIGLGIVLAIIGELTWFTMIVPGLGFLVPLTRFPGFVWLIAVGFLLPATIGERIGNRHQIASTP
jgi:hypothetical protein